jgi:shikimate dehydrogenase
VSHRLSASTELVALIGHPVRHSLSPTIVNAAFREMDLDWAFVVCDVAPGDGAAAVRGAGALGLRGLSVTMPHKDAAAASVDTLTPAAAALGAVNCVSITDGHVVGHTTDGDGFVASLRSDAAFEPRGQVCAVLGAGGAARAIVRALADVGASEILVVNRTPAAADGAVAVAPHVARVAMAVELGAASLVVNATSVGMDDPSDPGRLGAMPADPATFSSGALVADIVYHPQRTALLVAAEARGLRTLGGLGMLVHQAALAVRIWTSQEAPVEAMERAAAAALAARA